MPSSSSTTSTVVGGLCGSGLGMALTYVPSTTRASRAILRAPMVSSPPAGLTAVRGVSVGHWTDLERATGCSVVLGPDGGMRAACAVRGRATGTRELDALNPRQDRKSTRLNSSHSQISYAVFCLKKKTADVHARPAAAS